MGGYLLSRFERSVVFEVNSDPGRAERMAAYRSGYAGSKRSPADHSVGFGSRHWPPGRLRLVEGLKERLVWLKTRLLQILGHVILGFVGAPAPRDVCRPFLLLLPREMAALRFVVHHVHHLSIA